jgi:hypothetical protein
MGAESGSQIKCLNKEVKTKWSKQVVNTNWSNQVVKSGGLNTGAAERPQEEQRL